MTSPEPREPRDESSGQEDEREEGKEKEKEGSGEEQSICCELVVERLAVLKKKELGAELRHFDCCESGEIVVLLIGYQYGRSFLQPLVSMTLYRVIILTTKLMIVSSFKPSTSCIMQNHASQFVDVCAY